jgi:hypothetical protein
MFVVISADRLCCAWFICLVLCWFCCQEVGTSSVDWVQLSRPVPENETESSL